MSNEDREKNRERREKQFEKLQGIIAEKSEEEQKQPEVYDAIYEIEEIKWSLLQFASRLNKREYVQKLIEEMHVTIDKRAENQHTPLGLAIIWNQSEMVDYLVSKGANICLCFPCAFEEYPEEKLKRLFEKALDGRRGDLSKLLEEIKGTTPPKTYLDWVIEVGDLETLDSIKEQLPHIPVLDRAVSTGHIKALEYLLKCNGIQIDQEGKTSKLMPLELALIWKRPDVVKMLLEAKANVNFLDDRGVALLGRAIELKLSEDFTMLLKAHGAKESPENLTALHSTQYTQNEIVKKMEQYLIHQERDLSDFSSGGYCNGLCFLFNYYTSLGKQDYFYQLIDHILQWDGKIESLQNKPLPVLEKEYTHLENLFEEFIGHLTWFQMLSSLASSMNTRIAQGDRPAQIRAIGSDADASVPISIPDIEFKVSLVQLQELLALFSQLPSSTYIELGAAIHRMTMYPSNNGQFIYYDPNFIAKAGQKYSPEALATLIFQTRFGQSSTQQQSQDMNQQRIQFLSYSFPWQTTLSEKFRYFNAAKLPKTPEEAKAYSDASPNGFNHLHVAILTNSHEDVKQLITEKNCDVNHRSQQGETPLELAFRCKNKDCFKMILNHTHIDVSASFASKLISTYFAYREQDPFYLEHIVKKLASQINNENNLPFAVKLLDENQLPKDMLATVYNAFKEVKDNQGKTLGYHTTIHWRARRYIDEQSARELSPENTISLQQYKNKLKEITDEPNKSNEPKKPRV